MNSQPNASQDWAPVESGQLQDLSTRLRRPPATGLAKAAGATLVLSAAVVIAVGLIATRLGDNQPAPIACTEVAPELPAYASGECAEPLASQIAWHLKNCPKCSQQLAELRAAQASAQSSPGRGIKQALASLSLW